MTPEQMRAKSAEKVKQIQGLMEVLQVTVECRERVTPEGFIEKIALFIDREQYPQLPVKEEVTPETNEPETPANTEEN